MSDAQRVLDALGDVGALVVGELRPPAAAVVDLCHRSGLGPAQVADELLALLDLGHVHLRIERGADGTARIVLAVAGAR